MEPRLVAVHRLAEEQEPVRPGSGERRLPPGHRRGTVSPIGEVSGAMCVAAASIGNQERKA